MLKNYFFWGGGGGGVFIFLIFNFFPVNYIYSGVDTNAVYFRAKRRLSTVLLKCYHYIPFIDSIAPHLYVIYLLHTIEARKRVPRFTYQERIFFFHWVIFFFFCFFYLQKKINK